MFFACLSSPGHLLLQNKCGRACGDWLGEGPHTVLAGSEPAQHPTFYPRLRQYPATFWMSFAAVEQWKQMETGRNRSFAQTPREDQAACKQMPAPAYEAKLESLSLKQRTGHNPNLGPMAYDYQSFVLHKFHLGGCVDHKSSLQETIYYILYIMYYIKNI